MPTKPKGVETKKKKTVVKKKITMKVSDPHQHKVTNVSLATCRKCAQLPTQDHRLMALMSVLVLLLSGIVLVQNQLIDLNALLVQMELWSYYL